MKIRILFSAIFLMIFWLRIGVAQEETTFVKISDPVPFFEFERSPGKIENVSGLRGKTVLITFFATWCEPCKQELPKIQSDIYNRWKRNSGFEILVFGREHGWEEIEKFAESNKLNLPLYPDPERKIYSKFAGQYIPRNFLISKDGKVIFSSTGFNEKDFKKLKTMIEEQIKNN